MTDDIEGCSQVNEDKNAEMSTVWMEDEIAGDFGRAVFVLCCEQ